MMASDADQHDDAAEVAADHVLGVADRSRQRQGRGARVDLGPDDRQADDDDRDVDEQLARPDGEELRLVVGRVALRAEPSGR